MSAETPDDLWKEAMALLLRWQQAPQDEATRQQIRAFCARGEDCLKAWTEAKTVYRLGRTALEAGADKQKSGRISRRGVLSLAGVAIAGGAGLAYWHVNELPPGVLLTDTAQITDIDLADGSRLTLGPDTKVRVTLSETVRRIELLDGFLYCRLAEDERSAVLNAGPFQLETTAATLDFAFNGADCYTGMVDGTAAYTFAATEGELRGGDWMRASLDDGDIEHGRLDAANAGEWRQGRLIVRNERVDRVVAKIARWQKGKVLIADRGLAKARISGVFDASEPRVALETVVFPLGGRVRQIGPWITVLTTL